MLIIYFYMVIIKKYQVKNHSLTNFWKDWNKFPEIFQGKFQEIPELTTLSVTLNFELMTLKISSV